MFTKISAITLPVKDQEQSRQFYLHMLGCTVLEEMDFTPTIHWLRLEIPGVDTKLVLANWFHQMPPGCIQGIVLNTEDIVKTCANLNARGLKTSPIQQQAYGRESTFADPDGNGWVLLEPSLVS